MATCDERLAISNSYWEARHIPPRLIQYVRSGLTAISEGAFKLTFGALVIAAALGSTYYFSRNNFSSVELGTVLALGMAVSGALLLGAQLLAYTVQGCRKRGDGGRHSHMRIHRLLSPYGVIFSREQDCPDRDMRGSVIRAVRGVPNHRRAPMGWSGALRIGAGCSLITPMAGDYLWNHHAGGTSGA